MILKKERGRKNKMRNSKYYKKSKDGTWIHYPYKEKKISFCNVKYNLSDYKDINYITLKFKNYKKFGEGYSHTVDVSELLYFLNKTHKLKCNRMVLFDFDKKNNLLGIEIINFKEKKKKK